MGLDPDALQNSTATAVSLTMSAAAGQIEVIARNFAEGGMKRMFKLMLNEMTKNSQDEVIMRLNGQFIPVDPRVWNSGMDLMINVGLGTGKEEQKMLALNQTLQQQMQIWQAYGPQNGLVTMTNIRNTLGDMLSMSGIRNSERYFTPMTPEIEQLLLQQAQAAQEAQAQGQDPNAAYLQAEQMKAQAKAQTDMMKMELDAEKVAMEDDLKRDQMDQELIVKAAEVLGKYGTAVDVETIKTLQNQPRGI